MKIRHGFVSNSSSSSFMLPFNAGHTITITIDDLREAIDKSDDSMVDGIVTNDEELRTHLMNEYGGHKQTFEELIDDDEWIKEKYETYSKYINQGKSVMFGSVDQSDESIQSLIEKFGGIVRY